jgi:hypothetical protein
MVIRKTECFRRKLVKITENWLKSPKVGENSRKMVKIAGKWLKSPKVGENSRTF